MEIAFVSVFHLSHVDIVVARTPLSTTREVRRNSFAALRSSLKGRCPLP